MTGAPQKKRVNPLELEAVEACPTFSQKNYQQNRCSLMEVPAFHRQRPSSMTRVRTAPELRGISYPLRGSVDKAPLPYSEGKELCCQEPQDKVNQSWFQTLSTSVPRYNVTHRGDNLRNTTSYCCEPDDRPNSNCGRPLFQIDDVSAPNPSHHLAMDAGEAIISSWGRRLPMTNQPSTEKVFIRSLSMASKEPSDASSATQSHASVSPLSGGSSNVIETVSPSYKSAFSSLATQQITSIDNLHGDISRLRLMRRLGLGPMNWYTEL